MAQHEQPVAEHRHRYRTFTARPDPFSFEWRACEICGEPDRAVEGEDAPWYPAYTMKGASWPAKR